MAGRGGAALRALGTAAFCPSRPAARSETAGTCSATLLVRPRSAAFCTLTGFSAFTFSAFTNLCSARSYTIVELPDPAAIRVPAAPAFAAIVRATRTGAATSTSWFCIRPREGLFSTFHVVLLAAGSAPVTPRELTSNAPADRFSGVLPFTSNGCDGTIATVPVLFRSHTPVTGLQRPTPPPPNDPEGLHTHPIPG